MKQLEVQIMGQSYLLGCPEGGSSRLLEAVERVDTAMCKIRDAGKIRARERIAVLAALNLAFELSDRSTSVPIAVEAIPVAAAVATAPAATAVAGDTASAAKDPSLTSLLARLDEALNDDGQLI